MENLKIKVNSEAESKEVQELFFELGYGWHGKGKVVSYLDQTISDDFGWLVLWKPPYLKNTVTQMGCGFEDLKEITMQELNDMVVLKRIKKEKTMKEWIYKDGSGEYVLTTDPKVANLASDAVEVPHGVDTATICMNEIYFWDTKNNRTWVTNEWVDCDGEAVVGIDDYLNLWKKDNAEIIWQREKPQEKCADICGEVCGNNVQSTLEERESQYGGFSDVAELTCGLIGSLVRPGMSFVQREALHMICSKLARIHCGDINKIDSWHDIAGYATLVVKDLEKKAIDADKINLSDNRDWVEETEKNS